MAETLEGACPGQTHVERAQGAPMLHHDRHGDPPRQGMVLVEVTLPRLGGLGVFSNGLRQRIVERGARSFSSWRLMARSSPLAQKVACKKLLVEDDVRRCWMFQGLATGMPSSVSSRAEPAWRCAQLCRVLPTLARACGDLPWRGFSSGQGPLLRECAGGIWRLW